MKRGVGGAGGRFDIDEENGRRAFRKDAAVVFEGALAEGIEIEFLKGALGAEVLAIMSDQELAVDEVNVRFDAAESLIQSIGERVRVFVIVVGVGAEERDRLRRRSAGIGGSCKQRQNQGQAKRVHEFGMAEDLAGFGKKRADLELARGVGNVQFFWRPATHDRDEQAN